MKGEVLLDSDNNNSGLHVPSSRIEKYRNKITYSLPLPSPLSILAQDDVNRVCEIVAEFSNDNNNKSHNYDDFLLAFISYMMIYCEFMTQKLS